LTVSIPYTKILYKDGISVYLIEQEIPKPCLVKSQNAILSIRSMSTIYFLVNGIKVIDQGGSL